MQIMYIFFLTFQGEKYKLTVLIVEALFIVILLKLYYHTMKRWICKQLQLPDFIQRVRKKKQQPQSNLPNCNAKIVSIRQICMQEKNKTQELSSPDVHKTSVARMHVCSVTFTFSICS